MGITLNVQRSTYGITTVCEQPCHQLGSGLAVLVKLSRSARSGVECNVIHSTSLENEMVKMNEHILY